MGLRADRSSKKEVGGVFQLPTEEVEDGGFFQKQTHLTNNHNDNYYCSGLNENNETYTNDGGVFHLPPARGGDLRMCEYVHMM